MYPFHALSKPALPDDTPHHGFGPLPLDTLPIVIRSIPPDDRGSVLNLALVNKSAYLLTRDRRRHLAMLAESGLPKWKRLPTRVEEIRRFHSALHMACAAHPTMPVAYRHALLSRWIDKILDAYGDKRLYWLVLQPEPMRMLHRVLAAGLCLPMPESGELLWKLVWAQDQLVSPMNDVRSKLLQHLHQAASGLPEAMRERFALACQLADQAGKLPGEPAQVLEQALSDADAWPAPAHAMVLCKIASQLHSLPAEQREEAAQNIIAASRAWPARHRSFLLLYLLNARVVSPASKPVADCLAALLAPQGAIGEAAALPESARLELLQNLLGLVPYWRESQANTDGKEAAAATLDRTASRFLEQILALPELGAQRMAMRDVLTQAMSVFYGWHGKAPRWEQGFRALCAANRRVHGVSYGAARLVLGMDMFADNDYVQRMRFDAWRDAIAPLLQQGGDIVGTDNEAATWRLLVATGDLAQDRDAQQAQDLALGHAEALLARPDIMTAEAWVEMMCRLIVRMADAESRSRIMRAAMQCAVAMPDALQADLLECIVRELSRSTPEQQSGAVDMLLPMAFRLAARDRARLLPELVSLCLRAFARNGDARKWLSAILQQCAMLPEPLRMLALASMVNQESMFEGSASARAWLVAELQQQAAGLPAPHAACLLLNLAFCLGLLESRQGKRMFSQLLEQAAALDMPQPTKTAWEMLYRAAFGHHGERRNLAERWQDIERRCATLPEASRLSVQDMLEAFAFLPRIRLTDTDHDDAAADTDGWCAIL